jgi:hypothetical protein
MVWRFLHFEIDRVCAAHPAAGGERCGWEEVDIEGEYRVSGVSDLGETQNRLEADIFRAAGKTIPVFKSRSQIALGCSVSSSNEWWNRE